MIVYSEEPVALLDQELLKKWLSHRDAQLFKDCVISQMNQEYFEAINIKTKAKNKEDEVKFAAQAQHHLDNAKDIHNFLAMFERFASPEYGFHKIKIKT